MLQAIMDNSLQTKEKKNNKAKQNWEEKAIVISAIVPNCFLFLHITPNKYIKGYF